MTEDWFGPYEIDLLTDVIDTYYEQFPTGGSLHIVLDDHNWARTHIEFCAKYAVECGDFVGEAIAKTLLKIPDDILALAKECDGDPYAVIINAWRKLKAEEQAQRLLEDRRLRGVSHLVTVTGNGQHHECEHKSEAEAKEDFDYRVAAANEEVNVRRTYKIEMAPLGEAPILTHDKLAATHWKDQPGVQT